MIDHFRVSSKLKIFLAIFLIGFIGGIICVKNYSFEKITLNYQDLSKTSIFVRVFTQNIWTLFVVWGCGFLKIAIVFLIFIIVTKGYIDGISVAWVFKKAGLAAIIEYPLMIVYFVIMLPLFFYLCIEAYNHAFEKKGNRHYKSMLIGMIVVAIYSFISALIK